MTEPRPPRDMRYDVIVKALRDREPDERLAREKRQRWYSQHLGNDAGAGNGDAIGAPTRLSKFRANVPCRATPEARALLDELRTQCAGSTVTFSRVSNDRQAVLLTEGAHSRPRQIGWVEHRVLTDPQLCNARHQGLLVETDGTMLRLQFRYPATTVSMTATRVGNAPLAPRAFDTGPRCSPRAGDQVANSTGTADVNRVDFAEVRVALDPVAPDRIPSPRLVWVTRPEAETMAALQSRDYETFYVRFKRELLAGIWSALTTVLSASSGSHWHQGAHFSVVRRPDAATGKIHQRTVDDTGHAVDLGSDRVYDAFPATDILLLYLDGDILADIADIYFTVRAADTPRVCGLREELFGIIRRFWATSRSLASRYGGDAPAVVRMSQRALPMPAQVVLLRQDWMNLRRALIDRFGEAGRKIDSLTPRQVVPRRRPATWPFACFPAADVNVGLRIIYRQEWRSLGGRRGAAIGSSNVISEDGRGSASRASPPENSLTEDLQVETTIERGPATRTLAELVDAAAGSTIEAMKWHRDVDGRINIGRRSLAPGAGMDLESDCRESSRVTGALLDSTMQRMAGADRATSRTTPGTPGEQTLTPIDDVDRPKEDAVTMRWQLQNRYEILTRPAEIQNVVLIAEELPAPDQIDVSWVKLHGWILAKVLLDESFREVLATIDQDSGSPDPGLQQKRERLCEHLRTNILHYQRAIWRQEDPQQRCMRYRKSGSTLPLHWRFELESVAGLTIDQLAERLIAPGVDGLFAAYAPGRVARLDQLIDAAGLVGFEANYAIYRMRPEFSGADLFSMLHLFKSPYLHPCPGTGEPDIDDPQQIRMYGDAPTGAVVDQQRDAFRAQRAQLLAIDTDSVVIDVMRARTEAPVTVEPAPDASDLLDMPEGFSLLAEGHAATGVAVRIPDSPGTDWSVVREGQLRSPRLHVGADAVVRGVHEAARGIRVSRDQQGTVLAGSRTATQHERLIDASRAGSLRPIPVACEVAAPEPTPVPA